MKSLNTIGGATAALVIASWAGAFPGPDVILNDLPNISNHGAVGGVRAYTLGS